MLKTTDKNYKWWVTVSMSLVIFILCVDWTIVTLAIPTIAARLHSTLSQMEWILNAYVLTSSMFMILGGRLAEIYGKRKILLFGIAIFTVAVFAAGAVSNEWILIGCRAIQGIGTAVALPLSIIFMYEAFPESQQGFAVGMIGGIAGFSLAIGPTLGGFILNWLSWRWVFYINVPFGMLGLFLAWRLLVKDELSQAASKIDYFSAFVLSVALLGITLPLNESQNWGLSWLFWFCLVGGVILMLLLPLVGRLSSGVLIDMDILKNKIFILVNVIRSSIQYLFAALSFIIVLYLQNILGYSAMKTGLIMLSMTLIFGVTSPFSGKMVDAFGAYKLIVLALIASAISVFLLTTLTTTSPLFFVMSALFLAGLAISLGLPGTTKTALSAVTSEQRGIATAIYYTVAFIFSAIGIAVSGLIMAELSHSKLQQQLLQQGIHLTSDKLTLLSKVATGSQSIQEIPHYFSQSMLTKVIPITQQAFLFAFSKVMWVCFILTIFSLLAIVIFKRLFCDECPDTFPVKML